MDYTDFLSRDKYYLLKSSMDLITNLEEYHFTFKSNKNISLVYKQIFDYLSQLFKKHFPQRNVRMKNYTKIRAFTFGKRKDYQQLYILNEFLRDEFRTYIRDNLGILVMSNFTTWENESCIVIVLEDIISIKGEGNESIINEIKDEIENELIEGVMHESVFKNLKNNEMYYKNKMIHLQEIEEYLNITSHKVSPFILFSRDKKGIILDEYGTLSKREEYLILKEWWDELDEEEKNIYLEESKRL